MNIVEFLEKIEEKVEQYAEEFKSNV